MLGLRNPSKKRYRGFKVEVQHELSGWTAYAWKYCTIVASAHRCASAVDASQQIKKHIDDIHSARGVLS